MLHNKLPRVHVHVGLYLTAKIKGEENSSCTALLMSGIPTSFFPSLLFSAISVARRQMSSALRASPDTAATFLAASEIASGSITFKPIMRLVTIFFRSSKQYGLNVILVIPYKSNKKHHKGETGERMHAEGKEREEKEKKQEGRKREEFQIIMKMAKVDNGHIWGHVLYSVHVHSYHSTRHSI